MKPLNIIKYPDSILQKKASKVREETNWSEVLDLIERMKKTMYFYDAIGLAAPQVGVSLRIFVMQVGTENSLALINPEIVEIDDKEFFESQEGCLSFPLGRGRIKRPRRIKVDYLDLTRHKRTKIFENLEAACAQHEIDHLNGELFINKMSKLSKDMLLKKLKKRGII